MLASKSFKKRRKSIIKVVHMAMLSLLKSYETPVYIHCKSDKYIFNRITKVILVVNNIRVRI